MMRILLLFICMYSQLMSVESILMKFRAGSSEFQNWKKNDRMGDIPALQTVIGKHDSKPYVREELITM
ncbi:MAG: hypothetical protein ACO34C_09700, partial [Candidatus Kapaibacteriota bacterium]